jgi:hypothetical protein
VPAKTCNYKKTSHLLWGGEFSPRGTLVAHSWRINSIKGATDETITRDHVQENARAKNPTASDDLQTLRHTHLFIELFESPPGSSRQEKSLTKKGTGTMDISIIPWNVFLDALKKQQPGTLELWLRRWLFTNEGVIVADQRVLNAH